MKGILFLVGFVSNRSTVHRLGHPHGGFTLLSLYAQHALHGYPVGNLRTRFIQLVVRFDDSVLGRLHVRVGHIELGEDFALNFYRLRGCSKEEITVSLLCLRVTSENLQKMLVLGTLLLRRCALFLASFTRIID